MKNNFCRFCFKKTTITDRCKSCSNIQRKGFKMSEIAKYNISKSKLGYTAWNKGLTKDDFRVKKYLDKIDFNNPIRNNKIRQSKIGIKRTFTKEWIENLSKSNIKREKWKGKNNPMYVHGLTKPYLTRTHNLKKYEWINLKKEVLLRDGVLCNICKKEPKNKVLDHKIPYRLNYDNSLDNLQILCRSCHAKKDMGWSKLM